MKWYKDAAITELLLVGRRATIKNATPYSVNEYKTLNKKNITMFTLLRAPIPSTTVMISD